MARTNFPRFGGEQSQHPQDVDKEGKKSNKPDLRILPALVVDLVFKGALLVSGVLVANIQDLGIVKYLMVEAKDLFVLAIHRNRSHFCRRKVGDLTVEAGMTDCRPSSSKAYRCQDVSCLAGKGVIQAVTATIRRPLEAVRDSNFSTASRCRLEQRQEERKMYKWRYKMFLTANLI